MKRNLAASVRARLKQKSDADGEDFDLVLTRFALERLLYRDMKALVIPREIGAYLLVYMQAMKQKFVSLIDRSSHGTCKLISEKLWSYPVWLPPQTEQIRLRRVPFIKSK